MESLLSLSFDKISSRDATKISKGLRQIEGLLAQICLSNTGTPLSTKAQSPCAAAKPLETLVEDLAFREFFRLQESFEWNVTTRLVECLERLLGMRGVHTDRLIVSALDITYGMLLLHPPSRSLFSREIYMNMLLDLLDPGSIPQIISSTLLVLVAALLEQPRNIRTFEQADGLLTVTSLFNSRSLGQETKLKVLEFLYFYLMPEAPPETYGLASTSATAIRQRSPSRVAIATTKTTSSGSSEVEAVVKSTEEKQALLGKYLNNVADLVEDLRQNAPFENPT